MHRIDLAGLHRREAVWRPHGVEDVALEGDRREVRHLLGRKEHGLILRCPVGFAFLHEVRDGGKRVVVDRRLDVKHTHRVFDDLALADARVVQRRIGWIHV